jgi:glycosyltransferase involved in cell wall biosynthesis
MLGGGEHSFVDLLSHLPQDWQILAVLPEEGDLALNLRERNIPTYIIPLPSLRPWLIVKIITSLRSYYHISRRPRLELIYANGSRAALYGGIAGRSLNLPLIWHCRIADRDIPLDFILTRLSSRIVANSRATAKRFRRPFQSKVRVVHNGVDIEWLRDDSVSEPPLIRLAWKVILVVARVSKWKRHDLAISAFEQVAATDPNLHLVCVGSSDALEPAWWKCLKQRSSQSKVADRIHWIGQVADVRPWYKAARLLLLCSENEPFGRVLVEAMACGVPVVATRSGGIPEIVRNHQDGILVAPGKTDEFASAISEISNNDSLRDQLSQSAKKRAEDFSLEFHVTEMINVFENTMRNSNSGFNMSFR